MNTHPALLCLVTEKEQGFFLRNVKFHLCLLLILCPGVCTCSIPTYDTMNRFPRASAPPRHIDWWQRADSCHGSWKVLESLAGPTNSNSNSLVFHRLSASGHFVLLPASLVYLWAFSLLTEPSNTSLQLVLVLFCSQWLCRKTFMVRTVYFGITDEP